MGKGLDPRFGIKPHAMRRLTRLYLAGGVVAVCGGGLGVVGGLAAVGVPVMAVGAPLLLLGLYMRPFAPALPVVNRAFNEAQFGRIADAEELLDHAEHAYKHSLILRVIDLQRALIAMRRGQLEEALRRCDAAIERPLALLGRPNERIYVCGARAQRAVVQASLGDVENARADIREVRESRVANPAALAKVELAEAILLEKSGDRRALGEHLQRQRELMSEHCSPRERAIVRAFERLLRSRSESVYRKGAMSVAADEEPELVDWVAKVAPGAAPFLRPMTARQDARTQAPPADEANAAARSRIAALTPKNTARPVRVLLLWVLLVLIFLCIWLLLDTPAERALTAPTPESDIASNPLLGALFAAFIMGGVGLIFGHVLRLHRRVTGAMRDLARGRRDEARASLEALVSAWPRRSAVAAQAHHVLAELDLRAARIPPALEHCNQGIACLSTTMLRAAASDILLPDLLAGRAALLALQGSAEEARAEMDLVAQTYPSYPFLERARLRVRLMDAVRRGDVRAAAELADSAADIYIGPRDELLLDLARAATHPGSAGAGEVERLKELLRVDAESRRFAESVAPSFVAAFVAASAEPAADSAACAI